MTGCTAALSEIIGSCRAGKRCSMEGSCASVHLRDPCMTLSVVRATNDLCCVCVWQGRLAVLPRLFMSSWVQVILSQLLSSWGYNCLLLCPTYVLLYFEIVFYCSISSF